MQILFDACVTYKIYAITTTRTSHNPIFPCMHVCILVTVVCTPVKDIWSSCRAINPCSLNLFALTIWDNDLSTLIDLAITNLPNLPSFQFVEIIAIKAINFLQLINLGRRPIGIVCHVHMSIALTDMLWILRP